MSASAILSLAERPRQLCRAPAHQREARTREQRAGFEVEAQPGREHPGQIRVSAEMSAERLRIRLSDDGPGIPERLAERLFEPFVSGKASEGTGLGLTISRELAANHGGDLRLVATGPDGSTFELELPA